MKYFFIQSGRCIIGGRFSLKGGPRTVTRALIGGVLEHIYLNKATY